MKPILPQNAFSKKVFHFLYNPTSLIVQAVKVELSTKLLDKLISSHRDKYNKYPSNFISSSRKFMTTVTFNNFIVCIYYSL